MPKLSPLFLLLGWLMLSGCSGNTDPTALYNKKANELMAKVIEDSNCSCLFPIPTKNKSHIVINKTFCIYLEATTLQKHL